MSSYNDDIFNQSDDDIFNDDSSSDDTTRAAEYMAAHMKEAHGININADDILSDNNIDMVRAKIYISLAEASSNWVSNSTTVAFTKATQSTLDEVTDGRYSKLYYLYNLEAKITQRKIVIQFLKMMTDTDDTDFEAIKKLINLQLDGIYINSYVGTFLNIALYTVQSQIEMYLALAKDLGVTPPQGIDEIDTLADLAYSQKFHLQNQLNKYLTEDYLTDVLNKKSEN
jgi:hypothetical protein